jgi:hypothetical protein
MIVVNYGLWKGRDGDAFVFFVGHWGAEIEVFAVKSCKPGTGGGDDTVEQNIDGGKVGSRGADFPGVVDKVASNGESYTSCFRFVRSICGYRSCIGGISPRLELVVAEVAHDVSACRYMRLKPFGEATELIGYAVEPFIGVGTPDELGMFKQCAGGSIDDGVCTVEDNGGGCE